MVTLLWIILGFVLALANRFVPISVPFVWVIIGVIYIASLTGIARSTRLTVLTKVVLILLALVYGYYAYGLVAKVSGWTLIPSLLATVTIFLVTAMLIGYLKSLKVSLIQKIFVTVGALILLIVLNTVAWKPLDAQMRAKEGARQDSFFDNLIDPQKSTQPAVTKPTSTKASTTPKSTTADSTEVKPTPGTQKTNNVLKWTFISIGVFVIIVGFCSALTERSESNDE